jgi:peptide-methionine (S)-S-oxide reductase
LRSCSAGSGKVATRRRACVKAYRSAILATDDAQLRQAQSGAAAYGRELAAAGFGDITTEIAPLQRFYYAEDYHQQYLAKNPNGYCGLGGTGVSCPVGRES